MHYYSYVWFVYITQTRLGYRNGFFVYVVWRKSRIWKIITEMRCNLYTNTKCVKYLQIGMRVSCICSKKRTQFSRVLTECWSKRRKRSKMSSFFFSFFLFSFPFFFFFQRRFLERNYYIPKMELIITRRRKKKEKKK